MTDNQTIDRVKKLFKTATKNALSKSDWRRLDYIEVAHLIENYGKSVIKILEESNNLENTKKDNFMRP